MLYERENRFIFKWMTLRPRRESAFCLWMLALALAAAGALVHAGAARAESCTYNAATKAVTASITTGSQATLVVSAGQLWFGGVPAPCGAATTTNTDSIAIAGGAGTIETLILDQRGGFFGPGAAVETNIPEIEIATSLGDASDKVIVYATEGADYTAAGQNGFATSSDGDVDITFSPSAFQLEVHMLGGIDYFNGRGESGAGLHFLGPITLTGGEGNDTLLRGSSQVDNIDGGPGNDILRGDESGDTMNGGPGLDSIGGGGGDDTLIGGPGADEFLGSDGNDSLNARDDEVDATINGGPGTNDIAFIDPNDPTTVAVEKVIRPIESCAFDGVTKALSLQMTPQSTATLKVVGQEIWWGEIPAPCGSATVTNTDSITIQGTVGTNETLILDQRGGVFGPGATPETNTPEIEITTKLGDQSDRVIVYGTEGPDYHASGQSGFATSTDGDVDITFLPATFNLDVHLLGGDDHFDGRGTGGAGLKFLGPMVITGGDGNETLLRGGAASDAIDGGAGDDILDAQDGDDVLQGGPGVDTMTAGGGNDSVTGGPGIDTFNGNDGDDTFYAQDDEADALISGGPGADTAYIDTGLDPTPVTVETVIGDDVPPPPPSSGCSYDAGTKTATVALAPGQEGTLVVSAGAIHFGLTPSACGAATTANTDTITVNGAAGSVETLTIDQSGGAFAPGATAETGSSEIEISVLLGDATDRVIVKGTAGADSLSIGTAGIAVTPDADVDMTFAPLPAVIEVLGLAGPNTITGRGGAGSGGDFPNKLILRAGDSGDTLTGGAGSDEVYGGAGADTLEGRNGNDLVDGGTGNDSVAGNDGNDELIGGAGADALIGGFGDDTLRADDDEADTNLNGGPGADTAYYDVGIDVTPVAVETLIPA